MAQPFQAQAYLWILTTVVLWAWWAVVGLAMSKSCLDFVFHDFLPTCHRGVFLCIGGVDDSCHAGENQLQLNVESLGVDWK